MLKYSLILGNCLEKLKELPDNFFQCCITSPPYWGLRNYGHKDQIGAEKSPFEFVQNIVQIFKEVKRVLKDEGTCWLNIGDTYAGSWGAHKKHHKPTNIPSHCPVFDKGWTPSAHPKKFGLKPKELCGVPWRVAFALQDDEWYLRQDIIWAKKNCMPESAKDRCTRSHEYIFLLTKKQDYFYDNKAIFEEAAYDGRKDTILKGSQKYENDDYLQTQQEQTVHARGHERWPNQVDGVRMRNKRDVWFMGTACYKGGHFAVMPHELADTCIKAGTKEGDWVLDPFSGVATSGMAALALKRNYVGIELNSEYLEESRRRIEEVHSMFSEEVSISGE